MSLIYLPCNIDSSSGKFQDRRMFKDRRARSYGRRSMIRFDKNGGDRRSGYARRTTDEGFREQDDDE